MRILEYILSPKSRNPKATPELKVRNKSTKGIKLTDIPRSKEFNANCLDTISKNNKMRIYK